MPVVKLAVCSLVRILTGPAGTCCYWFAKNAYWFSIRFKPQRSPQPFRNAYSQTCHPQRAPQPGAGARGPNARVCGDAIPRAGPSFLVALPPGNRIDVGPAGPGAAACGPKRRAVRGGRPGFGGRECASYTRASVLEQWGEAVWTVMHLLPEHWGGVLATGGVAGAAGIARRQRARCSDLRSTSSISSRPSVLPPNAAQAGQGSAKGRAGFFGILRVGDPCWFTPDSRRAILHEPARLTRTGCCGTAAHQ